MGFETDYEKLAAAARKGDADAKKAKEKLVAAAVRDNRDRKSRAENKAAIQRVADKLDRQR